MATVSNRPGVQDPAIALAAAIAAQDHARRMQQYEPLGRLYGIQLAKGGIQFARNAGPGIGKRLDDVGRLLFLSAFPLLPDVHEDSTEFCASCLAECSVCKGAKTSLCIYPGCGGSGRVSAGEKACPDCVEKSGSFAPDCKTCGGYGAVAVTAPCPNCKGEGTARCDVCRGTGQQPTGFQKGASSGKLCIRCRGTMRAGRWRRQDLSRFVMGRMGDYYVIGPVVSMIVLPMRGDRGDRFSQGEDQATAGLMRLNVPPDEHGTPLLILLPASAGLPCAAYFLGGSTF